MNKVFVTVGLPGSGKSTWAKEYLSHNPNTKRVNKDSLRAMLDNSVYSPENEEFVRSIRDSIIRKSINRGFDVIVDDTNINQSHLDQIYELLKECDVEIIVKDFTHIPLEVCLDRNRQRVGVERIPDEAIIKMHERLLDKVTV